MGNPLFAKKPMDWLLTEAHRSWRDTLKRTLGPVSLTALGVGAIIGAGIFVLSGLGAHLRGPGPHAFIRARLVWDALLRAFATPNSLL